MPTPILPIHPTLSLSQPPTVYSTNIQTSNQQPATHNHLSAIVLSLQILVVLRLRELHRGVLPQEPLHSLDGHVLVEIDPFGLLLPVLRPRVEPNRGEVGDLRRLVGELVAVHEGLIEREILHFLIILREREEVQLHLDALLASLRVHPRPLALPRPRTAPSRPSRGSAHRAPTSAARFSTARSDPSPLRCSSSGCRSARARAPTRTDASASCRSAAPSPGSGECPPTPTRPHTDISAATRSPSCCSTLKRGNWGYVDEEGSRGGPLDAEMPRQTLVVLDRRLQTVRSAERFLGHQVEFVENVVEAGLGRVVKQNQLVRNSLALENLADRLIIITDLPRNSPTTLSL